MHVCLSVHACHQESQGSEQVEAYDRAALCYAHVISRCMLVCSKEPACLTTHEDQGMLASYKLVG